ncbi:MAG: EAL domain-containing protein [Bacillota bacterium]|nr:EAL domain-containing protein [Bacillota bacterium]
MDEQKKKDYKNQLRHFLRETYTSVGIFKAATGSMKIWMFRDDGSVEAEKGIDYDERNSLVAHSFVVPAERERFIRMTNRSTVTEKLKTEDKYCCIFNTINPQTGYGLKLWDYRYMDSTHENIFFAVGDVTHIADSLGKSRGELRLGNDVWTLSRDESPEFGVDNSEMFYENTRKMLNLHKDQRFVLARLDLDRFKFFNEIFGHEEGDALLSKIGTALREGMEEPFTCGHIEADHFAVCYAAGKYTPDFFFDKIYGVMEEYRDAFTLNPSMGIYNIEDMSIDVSIMCGRALLALQKAKHKYEAGCEVYAEELLDEIVREHVLINKGTLALENGDFEVWYQPMYDYATGEIISAEAIVRWKQPNGEILQPDDFIPVFEKAGIVFKIDKYVCHKVCEFLKKQQETNGRVVPVSFNVSRSDVMREKFDAFIAKELEAAAIDPLLLRVEITESAYARSGDMLAGAVRRLRSKGIKVYMDDFGSGYSTLNSLRNMDMDFVKLDREFCIECENDDRAGSILDLIIRLLHSLKIPVIVEGVESKEQADFLHGIGCRFMQGFYFNKPMSEEEFSQLLLDEKTLVADSFDAVDAIFGKARATGVGADADLGGMHDAPDEADAAADSSDAETPDEKTMLGNMAETIGKAMSPGILCYRNDDDGTIVYINESACKMLGYEREEIRTLLMINWRSCLSAASLSR